MKSKVMFFNAQEVLKTQFGYKLYKYDRETLSKADSSKDGTLGTTGRYSCGTEVRFFTEARHVYVTLFGEGSDGDICVYAGNYFYKSFPIKKGEFISIQLDKPYMFTTVNDDFYKGNSFHKDVWRICAHSTFLTLCDIDPVDGEIRPPKKEEMPSKTMLAYGSSITHGSCASTTSYSYISNVGRVLGIDILNKGVGGSCFCQDFVADMLVKNEFDYAFLELGVNMVSTILPDEFERRAEYLISKIAEKNVPVFMTTIYRYTQFYIDGDKYDTVVEYNRIIEKLFNKYKKDDWKLLDGSKILSDTTYLTCDGIHPSTEGHFEMAHNIVKEIADIVNR